MSYKTKQEAFAAMKTALATLQKLNLPLPKPHQDLVDKCKKVVVANTKTDAVAMDLGGDKTTLTITIDGLDFVPKHLKILSVANKNTVYSISKPALTTETVPIDKLKHGETYKVLLYADEKPASGAKPNNITPFTFDKKYDKVLVKIKTKSKDAPQKDQPQKCNDSEVKLKYLEAFALITEIHEGVLKETIEQATNDLLASYPTIIKALEADGTSPSNLLLDEISDNLKAISLTLSGYIPVFGDLIKDGITFQLDRIEGFAKHNANLVNIAKSSDMSTEIKNWSKAAKAALQNDREGQRDFIKLLRDNSNCASLNTIIERLGKIGGYKISSFAKEFDKKFLQKAALASGVYLQITCGGSF